VSIGLRKNSHMQKFYDTHAHLDYPDFESDLEGILQRAMDAGIVKIVSIGTDIASSEKAIALAERFPQVYAAIGWHPTNALEAPSDLIPDLRRLAGHPKVVAIGETGLDYHHLPSEKPGFTPDDDQRYKEKQADIFRQQLKVAGEFGLNCVIHQRTALEDTLVHMKEFQGVVRGVFHCFVDDASAMRRIVDLGSMVSFTGICTFKNAQTVRDTIAAVPIDQFMLETDCPYLAPVPYRGKRCEPAYVKEISEMVASIRNIPIEEISTATCQTALNFFKRLG